MYDGPQAACCMSEDAYSLKALGASLLSSGAAFRVHEASKLVLSSGTFVFGFDTLNTKVSLRPTD